MPIYNPNQVEYGIINGRIQIVGENNRSLPAYWAHPVSGRLFPAIALIHDWWGITPAIRRLAHLFAQSGYYVVVPDLFEGKVASTPQEAMQLVKELGDDGYPRVDASLAVLEHHHNTNHDVAAIGLGMGGSLAYEAAIVRKDLEAAVSFYGFPQRYFGKFASATTPILAIYGDKEPYVLPPVVAKLRQECAASTKGIAHEIITLEGVGRDFFADNASPAQGEKGMEALTKTFTFLEKYLKGPQHPPAKNRS